MLQTPTSELVRHECEAFDSEAFNSASKRALAELVKQFPENTEEPHILLKVLALNTLYSTRINYVDLVPLAQHIAQLGVDQELRQGLLSAVPRIADCPPLRRYLSFASKFASLHNSTAYPIYDRNVNEAVWRYQKQEPFTVFHRQDMEDYEAFARIVSAFRDRYSLSDFSFRELDKFLWNTGSRLLAESENPGPSE